MSEATPKLNAALMRVQVVMKAAKKDEVNPAFKDTNNPKKAKGTPYADMASCWEAWRAAKPEDHGLCITQEPTSAPDGCIAMRTCLLHESGEERVSLTIMPAVAKTPQAYGAAMSYARRYGFKAMVGMVDEDDDGNTASGIGAKPRPAPKPTVASLPPDELEKEIAAMRELARIAVTDAHLDELNPRFKRLPKKDQEAIQPYLKEQRERVKGVKS